jgi:hypothetical protein
LGFLIIFPPFNTKTIMKNRFFLMSALLFLTIALSAQTPKRQQWTFEQVQSIVQQYNLQDVIKPTTDNALQYMDKKAIEAWAEKRSKALQARQDLMTFYAESKNVATLDDYFKLIDTHPSVKDALIKADGNEIKHQEWRTQLRQYQWRIYRSNKGEIALRAAHEPISIEEKRLGIRVDKLSKNGSSVK